MLRSIFGSNQPVVLLALLPLGLLVAVLSYFYGSPTPAQLAGPAYDLLFAPVNQWPALSLLLGILVILGGALLLNGIFNEHEFGQKTNYLPAFVYFVFGISSLQWVYFNPVLLANVFLLFSLRRLFRIYRISNATGMLYDAGVFSVMAILVYPPVIFCIPFLWVGMTRLRSATFREWLVPAAGLATPTFYVIAAYWWFGASPGLEEFMDFQGRFTFGIDAGNSKVNWFAIFLAASLVPTFLGLVVFVGGMASSTVHRKNTKRAFLWFGFFQFVAFVYTGLLASPDVGSLALLAVPIAVFASRFFALERRAVLINAVFYVWLALAVVRILHSGIL